jgi:hypothetical protein
MSAAINAIRKALSRGQLMVVAGTGITASATKQVETSSWQGLINNGIKRCVDLDLRDEAWADRARGDVESQFEADLIAAAEKTTEALGGRAGAQYAEWLTEAVGSMQAEDTGLLDALRGLQAAGALIITTNYDGLLEKHLGLPPVTWRNPTHLQKAIREGDAVVHIHGHWQDPSSVVFGSSSYADVLRDDSAIAFLRASLYTRTVVFVGFGAGLRDPNFSSIRAWMLRSMPGTSYQHYRLVRASEEASAAAEHSSEPVNALVYGADFEDLAPFLSSLVSGVRAPSTRSLWDEQRGGTPSDEGNVRTGGIPLRKPQADPNLTAILVDDAAELTDLVAMADSPDDELTRNVGGGEEADSLLRFVNIFREEIREVQIIAHQPDRVSPEKIEQAAQWARRLLEIYGAA